MGALLEVLRTGPLSTVQDLGRVGFASVGVGVSGAADRDALKLANRLVGNPAGAAAVEVTLGGFAARADQDVTVAVTGAPCPITVDGRSGVFNAPLRIPAGAVLRLGAPGLGLRSYVAVRGGIDVAPVLGSRATDLLSGIGPEPLRSEVVLPIGSEPGAPASDIPAHVPEPVADELELQVVPGPRADWFGTAAFTTLLTEPYTVTSENNRIGIRLDGPELARRHHGDLASEGMVPGALQVPPSNRPVLFLVDHPVTAGFPVIAVVVSADVGKAAQARPGLRLKFTTQQAPSPYDPAPA
ncbi:biotin-dependent carboxyltransferase family protein [Saccharopolyspora sp. K220]|uniref:5-oxoprolinase subunit C family protein n=1 Tax=Saccharopolyspora soli TaxID=2926618 RepID=UPI001F57E23B|nr:biotin-dependent carboxyltransferase family protein [Saccharopolyspora soli]MCI2424064.1 biotin-dependent carboxyltransferase family protein [Saccharopolyspora soli]